MKTVSVELKSRHAFRLLKELERNDIIRVLEKEQSKGELSSLRGKLNLSEAQYTEVHEYIKNSRDAWERNT